MIPVLISSTGLEAATGASSTALATNLNDAGPVGQHQYVLGCNQDMWWAQGVASTLITSASATADSLTSAANKTYTGMAVQVAAVVDQAIAQAWQVSAAGVFVDKTTAINSATANDVAPFATGILNDYLAIGYAATFGQTKFVIGTSGTVGSATWEYWNGTAWAALTGVTDNTTQFKAAPSTVTLTYTTPSNWAPLVLNGSASLYYIRARALTTYTVNPLLTQAFEEGVLPTGLSAATNYWVIALDANTFQLATSRANALAGTAIDLTTNGGGVTISTVAVAGAGSAFLPAKTMVPVDGALGAAISVIQDSAGGKASIVQTLATR